MQERGLSASPPPRSLSFSLRLTQDTVPEAPNEDFSVTRGLFTLVMRLFKCRMFCSPAWTAAHHEEPWTGNRRPEPLPQFQLVVVPGLSRSL